MIPLLEAGPAMMFCPGDRPDLVAKALARADSVVVDLEDAVAPQNKDAARAHVRELARADRTGRLAVRVNAPGSPWFEPDLEALAAFTSIPIIVPMAEEPDQLVRAGQRAVIPLIETPRGVEASAALAASPTTVALMWGSEDLAIGLSGTRSRTAGRLTPVLQYARSRVLVAASAYGREAIDAVFPGIDADAVHQVSAEAIEAAVMGFAAKACIHPSQVAAIRTAFSPDPAELERAREIVELAAHSGGAFSYAGSMIDAPLVAQARRILSRT